MEKFLNYISINRVARSFILADLLLFGGWGLISPLMSVYVVQNIANATLVTVGMLATIYWTVRSLVQIPVAIFIDRTENEKDDVYFLVTGLLMISVSAFWLHFIETINQLFVYQAFHALGFGFYAASWSGIFSRHIDGKRTAFYWSLDHTILGVATGIAGIVGGLIAEKFGFGSIFTLAGILSFVSATVIFFVPDIVIPEKVGKKAPVTDHSPKNITHI